MILLSSDKREWGFMENATVIEKEANAQTVQPVSVAGKSVFLAFKRCFDVVAALTALLILIVPLLIIALVVKIDSPGPAF